MNNVAVAILKLMYGQGLPDKIDTIEVNTQYKHIDIWVVINETYNLIIEDKVESVFHGTQLDDYKDVFENTKYKKRFVYLKTGSLKEGESDIVKDKYEYKVVTSYDILKIFVQNRLDVDNAFFTDFVDYLQTKCLRKEMYNHFTQKDVKEQLDIEYKCNEHDHNCFYFWFNRDKIGNQYLAVDVWINYAEKSLSFILHGKIDTEGNCLDDMNKLNKLLDGLAPNLLKNKEYKFKAGFSSYKYEDSFESFDDVISKSFNLVKVISENIKK